MQYVGNVNTGIEPLTVSLPDKDPFIQKIHSKVMEKIVHSENIPGLNVEELDIIKIEILEYWNELIEKGIFETTATDKEARPYFVALQGIIERTLVYELNKSIQTLTGIIHTPMPATPLCTEGSISQELVDLSIADDSLRLFTVKARTTLIRDYLFQGGDLYIAYPKEGITKRTESQQQIYKKELQNYQSHLFDHPLECETIENDLVGAFYLFKNFEGKLFAFAIKMTQANSPQDLASFGLWFGEFSKTSPIYERISHILNEVLEYSPQPIPLPI